MNLTERRGRVLTATRKAKTIPGRVLREPTSQVGDGLSAYIPDELRELENPQASWARSALRGDLLQLVHAALLTSRSTGQSLTAPLIADWLRWMHAHESLRAHDKARSSIQST